MTIQLVKNTMYNLQTFLGDSGEIKISNIPTDRDDYIIYMQIDGKETLVKSVRTNGLDKVLFEFSVEDINSLGVGQWQYGVKLCSGIKEDTYIPDLRISNQALFIVRKMVVEGTVNE